MFDAELFKRVIALSAENHGLSFKCSNLEMENASLVTKIIELLNGQKCLDNLAEERLSRIEELNSQLMECGLANRSHLARIADLEREVGELRCAEDLKSYTVDVAPCQNNECGAYNTCDEDGFNCECYSEENVKECRKYRG
jgi:hypothetical protein